MDIVIVGGGKVGQELCQDLTNEGHNIVLIEQNMTTLENLVNETDIRGVHGNGALLQVQKDADVPEADIFISVTPEDYTNIISAITAKKIGAKYVIARVRDPEFIDQVHFMKDSLDIDILINPELEATRDIMTNLTFPSAVDIEPILNTKSKILILRLPMDCIYNDLYLSQLKELHPNLLVCVIERDHTVWIPTGNDQIREHDLLYLVATDPTLIDFVEAVGYSSKKIKSTLIVGGGRITRYLIPLLTKRGIAIKVIEIDPEICMELATDFPDIEVIRADGTHHGLLIQERIGNYDALISLTPIDEENLLLSLFAYKMGMRKTITRVNRTDLIEVVDQDKLSTIITPKQLVADKIIQFVRSISGSKDSNVEHFMRLANGVQVVEFHIRQDSDITHVPLRDLWMKANVLIAMIFRNNMTIIPNGNDFFRVGDKVLVVSIDQNINDIHNIVQ